ncbi:hypothetical protein OUZ56_022934 [Daphnia magna]|uniref:Uncharacterized protein n=1 Tax=Daphnia magna TaxID=35525 RepID=A0ABR0AY02_9CRUS|nr:hypothetical protein OUZ56_022934 [Daphnia magna]
MFGHHLDFQYRIELRDLHGQQNGIHQQSRLLAFVLELLVNSKLNSLVKFDEDQFRNRTID